MLKDTFISLNIKLDIVINIEGDIMFDLPPWFNRHLMRHTAVIPKGFLRQYVIKLLSEKPMSGSEIIEEILKRTGGLWKPSSGSIYPLLAWLRNKGFIEEVPTEEKGVKRYSLTEKGKKFLEKQLKILKESESFKPPFLHPTPFPRPFLVPLLLSLYSEKTKELRETFKELFQALFEFRANLECKYSDEAVKELKEALEHLINKIRKINEKLKE